MFRRLLLLTVTALACASAQPVFDPRDIRNGSVIPDEGYCDQPYIVQARGGKWLCVMTTGNGVEGERGQHIISTTTTDFGKTWSPLIDIEPAAGPEASWAMPFRTPGGRTYVFYTYNRDDVRAVNSNQPNIARRVDTVGAYVFKYSDDDGTSWSTERYEIPMRKMRIDRENLHAGELLFFWGVGKPITWRNSMIFGFAKVGRWGAPGTMIESQGCFMRSDNILTERDPRMIRWTLLPDGDEGLRAPKGPVADEANLVQLSDGTLYATYRTIDGYSCHAYSRDGGHTWTGPEYATYTPSGQRIKHPRAANFVRRFSNGKYLLWFHNHGGEAAVSTPGWQYYQGRNPVWVAGGIERDGSIHWTQPEILLYDRDPSIRISYPDFVEEKGRFFVTETQKNVAKVHEIDPFLLHGLWGQSDNRNVAAGGRLIEMEPGGEFSMPRLPDLSEGRGFTLDFDLRLKELTAGQILLDTRDDRGKGILLTTSNRFTMELSMNDGLRQSSWQSDPGTHAGTLKVNTLQHVSVIIDGGPKIITFIIDGILNDGGATRDYGWGRFDPLMGDVNGVRRARAAPSIQGEMRALRIYDRHLRTSEAAGNARAAALR